MHQRPINGLPLVSLEAISLNLASLAGEVNVLDAIDLQVAAGETLGVVGPSGSGKSTLLMIMAGLERPSSGKVVVEGQDFGPMDEDALARFRRDTIGIVFQSFHLIPTMTALENVAVPLELAGHADPFGAAAEELGRVGLAHRTTHYPGQLSGGEQQRVALARAFAPRPKLLLADEPTGNLDGVTGRAVMDLLFDLNARFGTALVLVTHDDTLAARCSRVVRVEDGKIKP
ncbi:ABC transporter ATP-binding protein YvcR [Paramagnetospirillum magnetotacticum MS-1]|uniref:ABC transporter ATP-binding protein YvcR n=1 Tax=Paramagnetospirillum magnetotacticum MS-1 TaxID=272627 RepID=A0A0C2YTI7_PARME|nr:ABC transporter ATP-binding protein [Paramagnetospirillum magnetotacticum]KIL98010.1 ABC transporter ATP-binding protein YvcR [Paramagnetospirillum magnetotacticum MS-1]